MARKANYCPTLLRVTLLSPSLSCSIFARTNHGRQQILPKGFLLHEESCQGWLVLQGGVGTSQLKILWVIAFLFQMPSYSTSVGITSFLVLLFGLWLVATQTATNANILIWGRQTHANIFIKWRQKRLLHSLINIKKKSFGYITRAPQHSPPDRYIYGLF